MKLKKPTFPELSKELDEYTGVTALGGSQTFTCEYHGDNAVSGVAWTYNDGVLPTGYSITQQVLKFGIVPALFRTVLLIVCKINVLLILHRVSS